MNQAPTNTPPAQDVQTPLRLVNAQQFRGQFVLARSHRPSGDGWLSPTLEGWMLTHCPSLPVVGLTEEGGKQVGWLLGFPILPEGRVPQEAVALPARTDTPGFADRAESYIASIAGRFAAVVVAPSAQRVYLDPAGQMSAVYNPAEQIVASTVYLAVARSRPAEDLIRAVDIFNKPNNYFPLGLTPEHDVRRLQPNHRLELNGFEMRRFWPAEGELRQVGKQELPAVIEAVAQKIRTNVTALCNAYPLQVALTAGRDTRIVLAAARPFAQQLEYFTIGHENATLDTQIAASIARRVGISYRVLPSPSSSPEELEGWLLRTGRSVAGRTWRNARAARQIDPERLVLTGHASLYRGYSKPSDVSLEGLDLDELSMYLNVASNPRITQAAETWLAEAPRLSRWALGRLLFYENRWGCWAGVIHYGHNNNNHATPLSDRFLYSQTMLTPDLYKAREMIVQQLWPGLMQWPFNRRPGPSGWLALARGRVNRFLTQHPRVLRLLPFSVGSERKDAESR